jgi:hypothetical protein
MSAASVAVMASRIGWLGERGDDGVKDRGAERVVLGGVGDRQASDALGRPVDQQLAAASSSGAGAGASIEQAEYHVGERLGGIFTSELTPSR